MSVKVNVGDKSGGRIEADGERTLSFSYVAERGSSERADRNNGIAASHVIKQMAVSLVDYLLSMGECRVTITRSTTPSKRGAGDLIEYKVRIVPVREGG